MNRMVTTASALALIASALLFPSGGSTHIDPAKIELWCELREDPPIPPDPLPFDMKKDQRALEYRHLGNYSGAVLTNCGGHKGHHTYYLEGLAHITGLSARIFTVEGERTVFVDPDAPADPYGVVFETSVDGITWTTLLTVAYVPTNPGCTPDSIDNCYEIICNPPQCEGAFGIGITGGPFGGLALADRQGIDVSGTFTTAADAVFLRVHQPRSALHGLAGYLEFSGATLTISSLDAEPAASVGTVTSRELTCASDVFEDFFTDHPCWFGPATVQGFYPLESGSNTHTYYLGPSTVTRVTGSATIEMFRANVCFLDSALFSEFRVEVSATGDADWKVIVPSMLAINGLPTTFDSGTINESARFVRVASDGCSPSNPIAQGFFLDSALTVEGTLRDL